MSYIRKNFNNLSTENSKKINISSALDNLYNRKSNNQLIDSNFNPNKILNELSNENSISNK
jgi:hypothetical protein